jgi:ring-1,2-phenylacetyl-CoA epoxidase subunit PaaC
LGDGTEESHERMAEGLDWFWRFVDEMFETDDAESALVQVGTAADRAAIRSEFDIRIAAALTKATVEPQACEWPLTGGRIGKHSEHLSHLLSEMQVLPRAHPEAVW